MNLVTNGHGHVSSSISPMALSGEAAARAPGVPGRPGHHDHRACRGTGSLLSDVENGRRALNITIVVGDDGKSLDRRVVDVREGVSRLGAVLVFARRLITIRCRFAAAEVVLTNLAVEVLVEIERPGLGGVVGRLSFFLGLVVAAAFAGIHDGFATAESEIL